MINFIAFILLMAATASLSSASASIIRVRKDQPVADDAVFTELIIKNDRLNFGTIKPWDLVPKIREQVDGVEAMCKENAADCAKRRPVEQFESYYPKNGRTISHFIYPEIEKSDYSGKEDRDTLIDLIKLAYANVTEIKQDQLSMNTIEQYYAPSKMVVRRTAANGPYGANLELKFVVPNGPPATIVDCTEITDTSKLSREINFVDNRYARIVDVLGVVSVCCEEGGDSCLKQAD